MFYGRCKLYGEGMYPVMGNDKQKMWLIAVVVRTDREVKIEMVKDVICHIPNAVYITALLL